MPSRNDNIAGRQEDADFDLCSNNCTATKTIHVSSSTHVEIAATVGSMMSRNAVNMRLVSVVVWLPEIKMAITTSSNEVRNANQPAPNVARRICGKVTVQKALKRVAPSTLAAFS